MKRICNTFLVALLLAFGLALPARAQISSAIVRRPPDLPFSTGNDFWLALPSNYWGENQGSKSISIYITSPGSCTATIEYDGVRYPLPVSAYRVSTFKVPQSLEMESSGVVESKGIHIYSSDAVDASLSVCFLSSNTNSSDGSYLLPTTKWGTDYMVAGYESLFEGGYDFPSECTIVASMDSTHVSITPTCDCRQCETGSSNGNAQASVVAFPAGKKFTLTLNRGQSLQLMPILPTSDSGFDLTGTLVHADQPIGLISGSMLPNIPVNFPYANFICEMIPPIGTWGNTYYASALEAPPGSDHTSARYLFIASKAGQTILRHTCLTNDDTECSIGNQYGIVWDELSGSQKFFSSDPFLVVGYLNSATYPDQLNGAGNPSEFAISTLADFSKSVTFEIPASIGSITPYTNFVNVICKANDAIHTTFDGKVITGNGASCIDDTFESFAIPGVAPGTHLIESDSGAAVSMYGYGSDASYAWAARGFTPIFHSPDTIAPTVDTSSYCFHAFIHLADSGFLPDGVYVQSGLGEIMVDTLYNMEYVPDAPPFIEGSGADTSGYGMFVLDPSKPAILVVEAYDLAGNYAKITSTYIPNYAEIEPPLHKVGFVPLGSATPAIAYDTIYNVGEVPFTIEELRLLHGDAGFSIFDSIGGPLDLSPIAPGMRRLIQIQFLPTVPNFSADTSDTIIFGSSCWTDTAVVIGSGGASDFVVTNQSWPNEPLGNCYPKSVTIENLSGAAITIDSAWWADTIHFKAVSSFPITVPASPGKAKFTIDYCPDSNSVRIPNRTLGSWTSPQVLETGGSNKSPRFDSLVGWAAAPSSVSDGNASKNATIIPENDGHSLEIILPPTIHSQVTFELVNVLGERVVDETIINNEHVVNASALPRGMYFYKLTSGRWSQSGKVILGE